MTGNCAKVFDSSILGSRSLRIYAINDISRWSGINYARGGGRGEREDWKESEALDEDRDSVVNNMHEITQLRYQRCRFARCHYATRSLVLYVFHYS